MFTAVAPVYAVGTARLSFDDSSVITDTTYVRATPHIFHFENMPRNSRVRVKG